MKSNDSIFERLVNLLDNNFGYVFEEKAEDVAERIIKSGIFDMVRCRDCKYYHKDADGYEMCDNSEGYDHVTADGFCAWAVKREETDV